MKVLQYITILLFALASVWMGCHDPSSMVHLQKQDVDSNRYFFISYRGPNDLFGDGEAISTHMPDLDTLRMYAAQWGNNNDCGFTYTDEDISITGIYEFKDSVDFNRFFKGKIIKRCSPFIWSAIDLAYRRFLDTAEAHGWELPDSTGRASVKSVEKSKQ